jgi:hypothetical protein
MPREGLRLAVADARAAGVADVARERRQPVRATALPVDRGLAEAREEFRRAAFARAMDDLFEDRDVRGR